LYVGSLLSILQSKARRFLKSALTRLPVREPTPDSANLASGGPSLRVLPDPEPHYCLPFQIDYIIARQRGGPTTLDNLAMACFKCNRFKRPNIAGIDLASVKLVRLFHPRTDLWTDRGPARQCEGANRARKADHFRERPH
jgi:hypothetical protein